MTWYKKVLKEYKNKIISSVIFSIVFALVILFWSFLIGESFKWREINPVPEPSIFSRTLYSALVYVTVGAFLYFVRFYQFLYFLMVKIFRDKQAYRDLKGLIWGTLILMMYFWIVPWIVNLINLILSSLYNIMNLILYLFPLFGASLVIYSIGYLIYKKYEKIK